MADIFVKDEGLFRPVRRLYVNREGTWTPIKEAWVKEAGVWRSVHKAPLEINVNLGDGDFWHTFNNVPKFNNRPRLSLYRWWQNINIKSILLARGWDGVARLNVTITNPYYSLIYSTDPNIPAVLFPSDLPAGSKIHFINEYIVVGGGGIYGTANQFGEVGGGGVGIQVSCNDCTIQITNYSTRQYRDTRVRPSVMKSVAFIAGGGGAGGRGGGVGIPQLDNTCLIYNGGDGGRGGSHPKNYVISSTYSVPDRYDDFVGLYGLRGRSLRSQRILIPDIDEEDRVSGTDLESILSPTQSVIQPAIVTGLGGTGGKPGQAGAPGAAAKINQSNRYFLNNPFPFCAQIAPTAGGPGGSAIAGDSKITWLERGNLYGSTRL